MSDELTDLEKVFDLAEDRDITELWETRTEMEDFPELETEHTFEFNDADEQFRNAVMKHLENAQERDDVDVQFKSNETFKIIVD